MSSAAVGTHSGAGPLSLMSCVRESSPLQDYELDGEKNVATKKKFWNPKKWFRRKNKEADHVAVTTETSDKDVLRSRSTSELSIDEEQTRRRSGGSMHPGLSVSHDSVFHSPNSGSDIDLDQAQSSSSLSISQPQIDLRLQTELSERLRLRRGRGDTSEDDEGLPHSPCNSPTTTEALLDKTAIKDLPTKSHSTCSDGSLLSMGSSEMDEESFGQQSRHSSKLSLHERRTSSDQDSDLELAPSTSATPLNHSAAHHRVAVRPKRRAPHRSKRVPQLLAALPTTPEVNEDSSVRSMTPETTTREADAELYSMSTRTLTESQLKCSSLPPGLAAPSGDGSKLNRSRSNAGSKSQDHFSTLEEDVEKEEKNDKSFFDRIFPRRSAKKRKSKEEKPAAVSAINSAVTVCSKQQTVETSYKRVESKPMAAPRSGAASRQRVLPRDLPASPEAAKRDLEMILPKPSPEKSFAGTSPLQVELENRFKQRQTLSTSPPRHPAESPPPSPGLFGPSVISKSEFVRHSEIKRESRNEEIRSKIPGLSSLQQRVLSLNDDDADGFKSLTEWPEVKVAKPVAKSHSFKTTKPAGFEHVVKAEPVQNAQRTNQVAKAASLDSVKHLEDPQVKVEAREIREYFSETKRDFEETRLDWKREPTTGKDEGVSPHIFADLDGFDDITISGPSHTAVVNVSSSATDSYVSSAKTEITSASRDAVKEVTTKESVSVTKIQLKRESTQIKQSTVTVPKSAVPEFLNRHLNKVEARSASNVVFSMNSPRIIDEQSRPKTVAEPVPRKFSQEDLEIVEKADETTVPLVTVTSMAQPLRFKKNEIRKPSVTSITPESTKRVFRSRSVSLDSLKNETESSDKSSQDSLDKLEEQAEETPTKVSSAAESVVLRKKSLIKQKADEEPELMKVFARRSLKLKDNDSDALSQQVTAMLEDAAAADSKTQDSSDKENQANSPKEERKKSITKEAAKPLVDAKTDEHPDKNVQVKETTKYVEATEVTLRKPFGNSLFPYQRTVSLATPKIGEPDSKVRKQASFGDRRRTADHWIKNGGDGDAVERKISQDEIFTGISPKGGFIGDEFLTETKNFNQRKAEWEKRAQEAQKKSVP